MLGASAPDVPWADTPDVNASKVERVHSSVISFKRFVTDNELVALVALVAMLGSHVCKRCQSTSDSAHLCTGRSCG